MLAKFPIRYHPRGHYDLDGPINVAIGFALEITNDIPVEFTIELTIEFAADFVVVVNIDVRLCCGELDGDHHRVTIIGTEESSNPLDQLATNPNTLCHRCVSIRPQWHFSNRCLLAEMSQTNHIRSKLNCWRFFSFVYLSC